MTGTTAGNRPVRASTAVPDLVPSGDGTLRGTDSSYGAGTYSAETGSFVVTLGALPDVGRTNPGL